MPRRRNKTRERTSSAADFMGGGGIVGLPDPGYCEHGTGDLRTWCSQQFLPAFDRFVEARPEMRAALRSTREFR